MKLFWKSVQYGDMGTESFKAFIKRNCDLCDSILNVDKVKNVLIFAHAANVRVINYYFKGKTNDYDFEKRVIEMGELISFYVN